MPTPSIQSDYKMEAIRYLNFDDIEVEEIYKSMLDFYVTSISLTE